MTQISQLDQQAPIKRSDKSLECGPLEYMFPGSRSKILDFLLVFRDFDYSITDIAKNSGLSFKTAHNEIKILKNQNAVTFRKSGKAMMFKLNFGLESVREMNKMSMTIATERITKDLKHLRYSNDQS